MVKYLKLAAAGLALTILAGCGQVVEVGPAEVGKVMTKNGYKEQVIPTSKFRLDWCWAYCDKLVVLDASDRSVKETMDLFMPKDKLMMSFDVRATMSLDPEEFDEVFSNVQPQPSGEEDELYRIPMEKVYATYARDIIRSEVREFLSQYSIAEIASSRDAINAELTQRLSGVINQRTPFRVRYIGLDDVKYPEIIVSAQEASAERREAINQEKAQLEISRVQLNRKLEEQQLMRKIEIEKAQSEAEVNRILGESMTEDYMAYRSLAVIEKMAESQNKVFMPVEMLQSIAGQVNLGMDK